MISQTYRSPSIPGVHVSAKLRFRQLSDPVRVLTTATDTKTVVCVTGELPKLLFGVISDAVVRQMAKHTNVVLGIEPSPIARARYQNL